MRPCRSAGTYASRAVGRTARLWITMALLQALWILDELLSRAGSQHKVTPGASTARRDRVRCRLSLGMPTSGSRTSPTSKFWIWPGGTRATWSRWIRERHRTGTRGPLPHGPPQTAARVGAAGRFANQDGARDERGHTYAQQAERSMSAREEESKAKGRDATIGRLWRQPQESPPRMLGGEEEIASVRTRHGLLFGSRTTPKSKTSGTIRTGDNAEMTNSRIPSPATNPRISGQQAGAGNERRTECRSGSFAPKIMSGAPMVGVSDQTENHGGHHDAR